MNCAYCRLKYYFLLELPWARFDNCTILTRIFDFEDLSDLQVSRYYFNPEFRFKSLLL